MTTEYSSCAANPYCSSCSALAPAQLIHTHASLPPAPTSDVNASDNEGRTALMHAAANNSKATVRPLLRAGASLTAATSTPQQSGSTALHAAVERAGTDVVSMLIQVRALLVVRCCIGLHVCSPG